MSDKRTANKKITAEIDIEYSPQSYVATIFEDGNRLCSYSSPDFHEIAKYLINHKVEDLIWINE